MSPRAAGRLEAMGFTGVFDYVDGKSNWTAYGLPTEREHAEEPRVGDAMGPDVPACRSDETVGQVRPRVEAGEWDRCMVLGESGVLLGMLGSRGLRAPDETPVENVMREGPSTFRPDEPLEELVEHMDKHDIRAVPVTTPDGKLLGVVRRADAETLLRGE